MFIDYAIGESSGQQEAVSSYVFLGEVKSDI